MTEEQKIKAQQFLLQVGNHLINELRKQKGKTKYIEKQDLRETD